MFLQQHLVRFCFPGLEYGHGFYYPPRSAIHSPTLQRQSITTGTVFPCLGFWRVVSHLLDHHNRHIDPLFRACIISAIRLQTLYSSSTSTDPSWDKVPSAIYGIIEINVGISCASVVTLRPLFHCLLLPFSKAGTPHQSRIVPQTPVRRRHEDDLVLMTRIPTQASHEDVELGGTTQDHSGSSVAESKTAVSEAGDLSREAVYKDACQGSGHLDGAYLQGKSEEPGKSSARCLDERR